MGDGSDRSRIDPDALKNVSVPSDLGHGGSQMPNLVCGSCGTGFWQGQGRPAKRCPLCREGDRYGARHQAVRAATVGQAAGRPCARCGEVIRSFDAVDLDHADDGSGEYIGWSHARCNRSSAASRGNAMRAAAYRALKGQILQPSPNGSGGAMHQDTPAPDDPADGTVRELEGGGTERWSARYRQWVQASRRW
jgi:hypothetical protein